MARFGTVITAMVTPFDDSGALDLDAAQALADHLTDSGSDSLVVSGTTGESPTLSKEEKKSLFKAVKDAAGSRAKIIAGTGSNSTSDSIELTREAEKAGVDAIMLVAPYYNKPPQQGLYDHFSSVAASTSLPVILYNVPGRTSCNIEAETVLKLAEIPNIVAIKEAGSDVSQISKIIHKTDDDFELYCGQDDWNLIMLSLGAKGFISVASHVAGKDLREMTDAFSFGDQKKAGLIHHRLMPLYKVLFMTTSPIMVKEAMNLLGIKAGSPRLPLVRANKEQVDALREVLGDLDYI